MLITCGALALMLVLEVIEAVAALPLPALHDVIEEGVVGGVAVADALHFDHFFVLDVEDNIAMLFALFNLVKLILTFLRHSHSRCLD